MQTSVKKPIVVNSWLNFDEACTQQDRYRLSDHKKETLTIGFLRVATDNSVCFPRDVIRLLIAFMFIDYEKPHMAVCVVGSSSVGKSTLCGRLLFDLGLIDEHTLRQKTQHAKKVAEQMRHHTFHRLIGVPDSDQQLQFHHAMDELKMEVFKGVSIEYHTKHFYSQSYHFTMIDVPGCSCYVKNMIYGACQTDVAILVISATAHGIQLQRGDHRKGLRTGVARLQALICYVLGIKQLVVCVNQMDAPSVAYSEQTFEEVKQMATKVLNKIGFKAHRIPFIPISALHGENVIQPTSNMPWYAGFNVTIKKTNICGYTLLDALDNVITPAKRRNDKPFRLQVEKQWYITGIGPVHGCSVLQGTLQRKDKFKVEPVRELKPNTGKISSIEIHHDAVRGATDGDLCGVVVVPQTHPKTKWGRREQPLQRGDIIFPLKELNTAKPAKYFTVHVYVQNHPGRLRKAVWSKVRSRWPESKMGWKSGYSPCVYVRSQKVRCIITDINWKKQRNSTHRITLPDYIEQGDEAEIQMFPKRPLIVMPFTECASLGRILAMDHNDVVLFGKVLSVDSVDSS